MAGLLTQLRPFVQMLRAALTAGHQCSSSRSVLRSSGCRTFLLGQPWTSHPIRVRGRCHGGRPGP
eukprot:11640666-Alexandrium_andersonii.AAC.1